MKGKCEKCGKDFEQHAQTYIVGGDRICRFCYAEHKRQNTENTDE